MIPTLPPVAFSVPCTPLYVSMGTMALWSWGCLAGCHSKPMLPCDSTLLCIATSLKQSAYLPTTLCAKEQLGILDLGLETQPQGVWMCITDLLKLHGKLYVYVHKSAALVRESVVYVRFWNIFTILQMLKKKPTNLEIFPHTCKFKLMFSLAGRYFYAPLISRCELQLGIARELRAEPWMVVLAWTLLLTHRGGST